MTSTSTEGFSTSLLKRFEQTFQDVLGRDGLELNDDMTPADVEGWDSLAHINLMLALEEAFEIRFDTAELAALQCVGDLKAAISQKMSRQSEG